MSIKMIQIRVTAFSNDLSVPLDLMRHCFPHSNKYSIEYLTWLYLKNPAGQPIGIHVFEDGDLKGQVVGIPQNLILKGTPVRALLLLDVAIHQSLRGRRLFLKGVARVAEIATELGYSAIIGVANGNTYRGYEQLSFQNVAGLDARLSLMSYFSINSDRAIESADIFQDWTDETLQWRLKNPIAPLDIVRVSNNTFTVEGRTNYPALVARAEIPIRSLSVSGPPASKAKPSVIISLTPKSAGRHRFSISIPERLRPSPLRLVYLNLKDVSDKLNSDSILFSFLDFDAF